MTDTPNADYESNVRIEYQDGPNRLAYLPVDGEPVEFGVHGAIAEHYGMEPGATEERNTTIDYLVAAAAG